MVIVCLTARNMAFDTDSITVPAAAEVTVQFRNLDDGISHNLSVYRSPDRVDTIFRGEPISGPGIASYTFTAPREPGTYYFQCDMYPDLMYGEFIVEEEGV
ncbi:MAG: cupredoxin domain-containing protein [Methanomicrobiales archaeon]|nr:cupredoxin domain-containing protein [Methanomicrobiales archaeon]